MKSFNEYCIEFIFDKLDEYENTTVYACDLAYELCEEINVNGTATFSVAEAKNYICAWWDDAANFSDYENSNFGTRSNPFVNPEVFMVRMIIEGCACLLSQSSFIDEFWDEEIELTAETIEIIKEQIKDKEIDF